MPASVKPPKPYPRFPLFAHLNGCWMKKIRGRQVSFGAWRWPNKAEYEASWKAALEAYDNWAEADAKGVELAAKPEDITLSELIDVYLSAQEDRVGKEIEAYTFGERRKILTAFRDGLGGKHTVGWLEDHPQQLLEYMGTLDDRFGFHRYNNHVKEIAGAFIAAEHPLTGVLKRPFRLRPLLKRKKEKIRRREKRLRAAVLGKQRWTPDELRAFFQYAGQPLKAQIALAYFAGFGNSDCADVPKTCVNFDPPKSLGLPEGCAILDWQRPKTEIERAAVLPADVAKMVTEAIAVRAKPAAKDYEPLIFLTTPHPIFKTKRGGLPVVREIIHRDDEGSIRKVVSLDSVGKDFIRFRDRLSKCPTHGWLCRPIERRGCGFRTDRKGLPKRTFRVYPYDECPTCGQKCQAMRKLGFYTFRHTATTYAISAASLEVRVLFEGHVIEGVRATYVEERDTRELLAIANRLTEKMNEADVTHSAGSSSEASAA